MQGKRTKTKNETRIVSIQMCKEETKKSSRYQNGKKGVMIVVMVHINLFGRVRQTVPCSGNAASLEVTTAGPYPITQQISKQVSKSGMKDDESRLSHFSCLSRPRGKGFCRRLQGQCSPQVAGIQFWEWIQHD